MAKNILEELLKKEGLEDIPTIYIIRVFAAVVEIADVH